MARFSVLGPGSFRGPADRSGLETKIQALQSLIVRLDQLVVGTRRLCDDLQGRLVSRRAVTSSVGECLTATALPVAPLGAHEIVVEELACAHRIASDALAAGRAVIPAGRYRFSVGTGEQMAAMEVHVEPTDVDADVVRAVAAAIDTACPGVSVRIETGRGDHGDEIVRLHLTSRTTGKRAELITADLSRNLLVLLGLAASGWASDTNGGTVTLARDAVFFLEGVRRTAPANRVYLEQARVFLALHDVGRATLTIRPDTAAIAALLADWAQTIGGALSLAAQPSVRTLLDPPADLLGTVNSLRGAFAACGIRIRDNHPPEIRTDMVARALDEDVEAFFARLAGLESGLGSVVLAAAKKEIVDCRRAIAALHRQAEWYRQVPSAQAARRLARQAVAAYSPSSLRLVRTE